MDCPYVIVRSHFPLKRDSSSASGGLRMTGNVGWVNKPTIPNSPERIGWLLSAPTSVGGPFQARAKENK
jgi:hypothetical protein